MRTSTPTLNCTEEYYKISVISVLEAEANTDAQNMKSGSAFDLSKRKKHVDDCSFTSNASKSIQHSFP